MNMLMLVLWQWSSVFTGRTDGHLVAFQHGASGGSAGASGSVGGAGAAAGFVAFSGSGRIGVPWKEYKPSNRLPEFADKSAVAFRSKPQEGLNATICYNSLPNADNMLQYLEITGKLHRGAQIERAEKICGEMMPRIWK